MIKLNQVSKTYHDGKRDLEILKGIDLELAEPKAYCILGKSGAGKSTLLHLLAGIEQPTAGEITINQAKITDYSEDQLAVFRQKNIGLIFQLHNLLPEFTALENVMLPALIQGELPEKAEAIAEAVLKDLGLIDRMTHRPSELSGGEQQRVAIARAIVTEPKIILADEPTGSLDAETAAGIEELLLQQVEKRRIFLVCATHNQDFANKFEVSYRIEQGKIG